MDSLSGTRLVPISRLHTSTNAPLPAKVAGRFLRQRYYMGPMAVLYGLWSGLGAGLPGQRIMQYNTAGGTHCAARARAGRRGWRRDQTPMSGDPAMTHETPPVRRRAVPAVKRGYAADRTVPRAEPIDRLRDDVRLLGDLVGEVLAEQGGARLFAAVEYVRTAAIALRSQVDPDPKREAALLAWAGRQSTARLLQLVRAFSVYFHLINLAEQHHRVRTLFSRDRSAMPLHESIAAAVETLRAADVTGDTLRDDITRLEVRPVFTAHPSEARRRTLLHHLRAAASAIAQLDAPPAAPGARAALLESLRTPITLIWQTAEARTDRPTVLDEVNSVLYFLAGP